MKKIIVEKCEECPFKDNEYSDCNHPDAAVPYPDTSTDVPPYNCPLREASCLIRINAPSVIE